MKHKLLLAVIQLVVFSSVYAQNVNGLLFDATNTNTRDASAAFEINANTNTPGSPVYGGLLIPRVALTGTTDAATISGTEATSLLVYNTATVSDVTPGFYYWNGSSWLRIISGNGSFPTGSGTTNYLARWTSANTLGIGVSYDDGTNVGIGITSPQKKLDVLSTVNDFVTVGANTFGVGQWTGIHFGYRENNSSYRKSAIVFERTDNSGGGGNAAGKIHLLNGPASGAGSATLADSRLTVGENGNVGIGETAPVFRLHVKGGNANTEQMTLGATTTGNFALTSQDGGAYGLYAGVGNTGNAWLQVGRHNTATAYNLILQASGGNVGVGNTGPGVKLHVTGNAFFDLPAGGGALENSLTIKKNGQGQINFGAYPGTWTPALQIQNNDNSRYVWISPLDNASGGNSRLVTGGSSFDMYAGNVYSATFATSGNVGVGTTVPSKKLNVVNGSQTQTSILSDGYTEDVSGILDGNYVPSHTWNIGTGSVGIFNQNGLASENTREWGTGPHGNRTILWKSSGAQNNDDGGWNTSTHNIDHTKTYRVSIWVKRTGGFEGTTYFGIQGANVTDLNGVAETNPYFWCSDPPVLDRWYLIVGYIHGSGDATTIASGGVYDGVTGQKIVSFGAGTNCATEFKFTTSATTQQQRAYLYYNTNGSLLQYFWDPRFEEVNGKEPTINALLGISDYGSGNYIQNQTSSDQTAGFRITGNGLFNGGNVGIGTTATNGRLDVVGDIFGVNEYSFQGCTESIKDWDYSGLNINPTCNGASDDSWYIQSNSNEWSRGVLSRRRFSRTPGLTLEYEAYLQQPIGGNVHYMIGFVDGNSTSYSYCQNPSNLMYHDHAGLSVYENCGGQGSNYSFDTRNAWYKFKVVLKGAGANYYVFYNGSWRLVLSTANNSNKYVRILISAYNNRLYIRNMKVYQSDFNNFDATGVNASSAQYVASNSGAVEVSMGSYPAVSKGGDPSSASNATLVMGSITVSGNDIRFANGIGGLGFPGTNSVQNLAHGMASFTVSLEKRINGGVWVSVYSQSAMCAFAVGDYYMQANGLTNAFGISGDMYRYPNSVSFSYFDTDATVGNYEYRLVFTPGGYNKLNGYNYSITQRNLTAIQIKR
ncbi:MAG: hypothetical protein POELPBGB_01049 [Bacteroidia bacterium]|nr:hypothetical protein [Bacteroidia bacterium]